MLFQVQRCLKDFQKVEALYTAFIAGIDYVKRMNKILIIYGERNLK